MNNVTPLLNGSVLDAFSLTQTTVGSSGISMAKSSLVRWNAGSKASSPGTVSSLARRKSKKAKQHAVHNMTGCTCS